MIDAVRGVLRVRKWPRKRGAPTSERQLYWIDWFRQANLLAKYADPMSQARAKIMTAGTGLYPRDVLLSAMRGRLWHWADSSGWKWYSMAAIGDISESLDVLAQTLGDVLVRAGDRWRSAGSGDLDDVLTHQGPDNPPAWLPGGGGGGGKSLSAIDGHTSASGSTASQGWAIRLATDVRLYAVLPSYIGTPGLTYIATVVEVVPPTIVAIIDQSPPFTAKTSNLRTSYIPLPGTPLLNAGTVYGVLVTRTELTASTNSRLRRGRTMSIPLPCDGYFSNMWKAVLEPAVSDTYTMNNETPWTANVLYSIV